MITQLVAKTIQVTLPAKKWYRAAFLFAKYYAKISKAPTESWVRKRYPNSFRMNHAMKLEALLSALTAESTAPIFPIPVRGVGANLACFDKKRPNGLFICTVHTPLNLLGGRHFIEKGLVVDGIIARYPPASEFFTIPGTSTRIPAIVVDRTVLHKAKSILNKGGTVITAVDHLADGQFSPNQFRLAAKLEAELLLVIVELQPDGVIQMTELESLDFAIMKDTLTERVAIMNERALCVMREWC